MYINFGSVNSRQAADGSCTAPLTVDSCGTCRLKKHASLPTITRYDENAYQLFYIAAGKAHFWFDDAEHVVTAGHMVLYRPQEERRYIYYLEDHPEVFWVYFSGSEAAAVLQAHEIPLDGHVFYSGIMPEYKNTFRRMIQELQLCQYAYRDYTAGLFQMMLVLVSRQRQERRSINGTTREQIEAAAAYFNENYIARINVDEYAESLHMSTAWFIRSFKQYVGLSPARYIQSLRIVNAQRLLERTKYSIGEVSEIVGYDNPLYFSRVFKKETGLSPAQYRKAERAGEQPSDPQEEDACTPPISTKTAIHSIIPPYTLVWGLFMFAAAICVSILLGVLVWALPGRLCDRRATHADVLAGPGIVLAVWIIAACVFAQPGLAQGFDLFRLLAINGAALWACGTVLLLRLRSGRRYRTLWTVAALLIAAIGLEVFVGNAPYFATHGYQPVDLRAYLQDAPADGEPIALNDEHRTLTFTGIHQPLYNVALDGVVYQYDGNYPQDQNPLFILWVSGTDEASTAPRQSWQWQAAPRAARSLVRTLDFSGAVDTLTLQAEGYSGEYRSYDLNYTVQAVLANVPRPMDFSLLRLAVVYLALLALWGLRPGAAAWHEAYLTHRAKYRPAVLVLGCMLCLLAAAAPFADARNSGVATSFYNVENWDGESRITFTQHISDWQNDSAAQYGALAHSLLNGRLDLQRDPPAAMAEMQNPYDTAARQSAAPDALWDVAYYQGRYYVYFGIVPCLLFQLPFELLTGVPDLPPSLAMIVMAWLLILAVFGLVRQAAQRWFPSASAAACLLAAAGIAGGSQVYYLLLRPSVYEYAILCGAAFVLLALWQWLCAANTPVQHHGKIMLHMALGSLCMALVAGCRPQMELFAVLCLPIFWPQYIRQKRLRSKQGITEAIAFVLPVILVALGLMAYNAARFGSLFDFGANYNLTSNDMTHRGFRIGRLAPALFTYFLSLPVVQAVFPYLAGTKMQTNFMGMTITEVFYGGALVSLPLLWAFAALPLLRRRMARQKDLRAMVLLPVLLAVILAALDCQMAGVLYRYLSDYLTPLLFAAALVWLWAESALAPLVQAAASGSTLHTVQHMLQGAMLAAVAVGICYSFCVYFAAEPGLLGQNPALYQNVSRLVQFWL